MMNYDIIIVSHEKDFNNIKYIVEHCDKNLKFDSIHLIVSDRVPYSDMGLLQTLTKNPIYLHLETNVLTVDKTRLHHRPNWIYQRLLKIFQNVTASDSCWLRESD